MMLLMLSMLVYSTWDNATTHQNQINIMKAKDVINEISKGSELVYNEGNLAKTKVFIHVPSGVIATSMQNNILQMNLSVNGEVMSVTDKVRFPVQGEIPSEEGYYWVNITSHGSYVLIEP